MPGFNFSPISANNSIKITATTSSAATLMTGIGNAVSDRVCVRLANRGSYDVFVAFGVDNTVAATATTSFVILAGTVDYINPSQLAGGTTPTYIALISPDGSTDVIVTPGAMS